MQPPYPHAPPPPPPPPNGGSALATFELVIDVGGGVVIKARPKRIAHPSGDTRLDKWVVPIDVQTPIGQIDVHLGMSAETLDKLMAFVRHYHIAPRLADLLSGEFGLRPVMRRQRL
jgi:hypothetical protein